jgi:hypothetical protein
MSRATSAERADWAEYFDAQVKAGAKVNRNGGLVRIRDKDGDWFQRDGNSCDGSGWHSLAGEHDDMRKPPRIR